MDFIRYAEGSAGLLNVELAEVDDLVRHLAAREELQERATDRDCMLLRKFQRELRPVFEASEAGDAGSVVEGLNELMARYPITPRISDHDPSALHLHVAATSSVAELLVACQRGRLPRPPEGSHRMSTPRRHSLRSRRRRDPA